MLLINKTTSSTLHFVLGLTGEFTTTHQQKIKTLPDNMSNLFRDIPVAHKLNRAAYILSTQVILINNANVLTVGDFL